jgi:hypothetical protein
MAAAVEFHVAKLVKTIARYGRVDLLHVRQDCRPSPSSAIKR